MKVETGRREKTKKSKKTKKTFRWIAILNKEAGPQAEEEKLNTLIKNPVRDFKRWQNQRKRNCSLRRQRKKNWKIEG